MKLWKRISLLLCVSLLFGSLTTVASASENNGEVEVKAKSVVLMEAATGQVLLEQNAHEKLPPASITKIMTLLLVMEAIDKGALNLTDPVTTSESAAKMGGSQIWLEVGETMTVDELIKATAVASANDAAYALGEKLAGTETAFVAKMNERAQELGMTDTTFVNCCGLDADGHLSSAMDVAIMSRELIKYPLIKEYSTIWMDSLRQGKTELTNTNKLVRFYDGITGLKTGTTSGAGSCVSATAAKDGMELIAVVMGSATSDDRFSTARKLLDYGFASYALYTPDPGKLELAPVKVLHGVAREVEVQADCQCKILVKKGMEAQIQQTLTMSPDVMAPVGENQILGKVTVTLDSQTVGEYLIKAKTEVEKMDFKTAFSILFQSLFRI